MAKLSKTEYRGVFSKSSKGVITYYINYRDKDGISRRKKVKASSAKEAYEIKEACRKAKPRKPRGVNYIRPVGDNIPTVYYATLVNYKLNTVVFKIGVSCNVDGRIFDITAYKDIDLVKLETWTFSSIKLAEMVEQYILDKYEHLRHHKEKLIIGGGNSEVFKCNVLTQSDKKVLNELCSIKT